jgi:ferredoxin-NADP reductase
VKAVVQETADTRSLVLDVPPDLRDAFTYRPGQFCTFRVQLAEGEHARCYSMSSAPETDDDLTVTVKRVPGGLVSNWLNDHVAEGDVLEVTRPAGTFCVPSGARPVIGFCGGSGVTPVLSIAKSVLASSTRSIDLLYANRDRDSVIFEAALASLERSHPDRFRLQHHLDAEAGFLDAAAIVAFVDGRLDADFSICGPAPFMDLVEAALLGLGVDVGAIHIERFATGAQPGAADLVTDLVRLADADADAGVETAVGTTAGAGLGSAGTGGAAGEVPETIVLILKGKRNEIDYRAGDTVLETARRGGVAAPYSCEAGSCATCMALVREGSVAMRVNDALEADEVEEGWVLTCQSVPTSPTLTIEYEPL